MDSITLPDIIGATLYITVDKNRSLKGMLVAIDAQANLLLDHVEEYCQDNQNIRKLGLVSVPFDTIDDIQVTKTYVNTVTECKITSKNLIL